MKLSEIKSNPKNPRVIKDHKFEKLKANIEAFPKMLKLRPIVVDNKNMVLGGNMRLRALKDLGYKEIPDEWVVKASELTAKERKKFIVLDNNGFGEWDYDILSADYDLQELLDMGLDDLNFDDPLSDSDIPLVNNPEMKVSEELKESHNYVVLYFDNEIDWRSAKSKLGISSSHSFKSKEGREQKGIGRVINGSKFIERLQD